VLFNDLIKHLVFYSFQIVQVMLAQSVMLDKRMKL